MEQDRQFVGGWPVFGAKYFRVDLVSWTILPQCGAALVRDHDQRLCFPQRIASYRRRNRSGASLV